MKGSYDTAHQCEETHVFCWLNLLESRFHAGSVAPPPLNPPLWNAMNVRSGRLALRVAAGRSLQFGDSHEYQRHERGLSSGRLTLGRALSPLQSCQPRPRPNSICCRLVDGGLRPTAINGLAQRSYIRRFQVPKEYNDVKAGLYVCLHE